MFGRRYALTALTLLMLVSVGGAMWVSDIFGGLLGSTTVVGVVYAFLLRDRDTKKSSNED